MYFEVFLNGRGHLAQNKLPKSVEVALPEEVLQRLLGPLGRVDVSVTQPCSQCLRGHVHDFDLVRLIDGPVGDTLFDRCAGDRLDYVREALQVLDVDRANDGNTVVQEFVDVLPAFLVLRTRRVCVGEFVDAGDLRVSRDHRIRVHLFE
jgi:hypothetical protein